MMQTCSARKSVSEVQARPRKRFMHSWRSTHKLRAFPGLLLCRPVGVEVAIMTRARKICKGAGNFSSGSLGVASTFIQELPNPDESISRSMDVFRLGQVVRGKQAAPNVRIRSLSPTPTMPECEADGGSRLHPYYSQTFQQCINQ